MKQRKFSGTTLHLTPDILKKLGPSSDRLGMTATQVVASVSAVVNHGGGSVEDIVLSKSSAIRARDSARTARSDNIKNSFSCKPGQINFDSKLMKDLNGNYNLNMILEI